MIVQRERAELFRESARRHSLLKAQIELTHGCNLRCAHCRLDTYHREDELTVDDVRRLLPELASAGCFNIGLTGGEFLTRPDVEELLGVFFEAKFLYTLLTNATLVDERILGILEQNRKKIRSVVVSLYAMDGAVHDSITRVEGSREMTLDAMKRMKERGIPVSVSAMLMSPNYEQAGDVGRFCEAEGFPYQLNALLAPQEGGGTKPFALRLTGEHLARLPVPWEKVINLDAHFNPATFSPDDPTLSWCPMGRSSCFIESSGEVYPCSTVWRSAGNVRRGSFGDIWANSAVFREIRSYRKRDFECAGCELLPECLPCPGLAYAEHGDIFAAPKEKCRMLKTCIKGGNTCEKALC